MSSSPPKQNQHYVPQFILRRFHNEDNHLHVYDKWTRRSFVSSTRNVASEKGFYNIEIDDKIVSLEPVMCEIENHALETINSLTVNASLTSISTEQKHAVAYFFATQLVRTRFMRDTQKHIQDEFMKILPKKNLKKSVLPEGFFMDDEQLKISSLINLRLADELVPLILNKTWLLIQAPPGETFFISDNPLVRYNEQQSPLVGTNGLDCPGIQVHMPLSPTITLSFMCKTLIAPFREHKRDNMGPEESIPLLDAIDYGNPFLVDGNVVKHINSLQLASASRFIFASHSDFSFVEEVLNTKPEFAKPPYPLVR